MSTPIPGLGQGPAGALASGGSSGGSLGTESAGEADFMNTLRNAMDQVGQLQGEADGKVTQLLNGNGQDVHSAMIAVEKANLAFEMMVQVRNKIIAAYQQVSGIPF
jgi:flagellar hook-basal body complex protein FliE